MNHLIAERKDIMMSFIVGIACEVCGTADADVSSNPLSQDDFPRDGWISVTMWEGEQHGTVASPEFHLCSAKCLRDFSDALMKEEHDQAHEENQPHEH